MFSAVAAALSLQLEPMPARPGALSIEGTLTGIFRSDGEAVNFSAHAAWSVAVPLTGQAMFGRPGLWTFGGGWMAYTMINEFTMHGPESPHERTLNLISRLAPCGVILLIDVFHNAFGAAPASSFDNGNPGPIDEHRYDVPRVEEEPRAPDQIAAPGDAGSGAAEAHVTLTEQRAVQADGP